MTLEFALSTLSSLRYRLCNLRSGVIPDKRFARLISCPGLSEFVTLLPAILLGTAAPSQFWRMRLHRKRRLTLETFCHPILKGSWTW